MLGVALALSASLGFGASAIFVRLAVQHVRPTTATLVSLVIGTLVTMTIAFALHSEEIVGLKPWAFLWILLGGFLTFPLGRLLNFTGVSLAGVSRATPTVGASPLFAAVLAVSILGESLTLPILFGTILIIGGLAVILSQR